jgi:hypothetical protein
LVPSVISSPFVEALTMDPGHGAMQARRTYESRAVLCVGA